MPCDSIPRGEVERRKREQQIKELETALKNKSAQLVKTGNTISIENWDERGEWCDDCAIRRLRQSADFEVRRIIAAAVPQTAGIVFGHGHSH